VIIKDILSLTVDKYSPGQNNQAANETQTFNLPFTPQKTQNKQTPWSESASELHRPSNRRLSVKSVSTFADKGCHVVSVTDFFDRILGFLDWSRYFF
jgi:hypothetical protein